MSSTIDALLHDAAFTVTRWREGYDMSEVDALLEDLTAKCLSRDPQTLEQIPAQILNAKFQVTRWREGYDMVEVDDFLDELVAQTKAVLQGKSDAQWVDDFPRPAGAASTASAASTNQAELGAASSSAAGGAAHATISRFSGLVPLLNIEFPEARGEGYAKKDIDSFVGFLEQLTEPNSKYIGADALQVAEHLTPKSAGFFAKGYDKSHVDAFLTRVVAVLKTL